jgi:hypothetical protein
MRHNYEHVFAWSEPVAVKINRNGRLLGSTAGKPTAGAVGSTATVRIPIPTLPRVAAAASPSHRRAETRVDRSGSGHRGCVAIRPGTPLPLRWTSNDEEPKEAA